MLDIILYPVLKDNYNYLLHDRATGQTAVVDPSEAESAERELTARNWRLDFILNTHHHADHIGGNAGLKARYGCSVVGYAGDRQRIAIDIPVQEGECFALGESAADIWYTPGHTLGHIAYYFAGDAALFCGDTLFASGCGRLFEGTAEQMWANIRRIRDLPDAVQLFCAHEYTLSNLRFARHLLPEDEALRQREAEVLSLREQNLPTIPTSVGQEKICNPFLQADQPHIGALYPHATDAASVFAQLRQAKDGF